MWRWCGGPWRDENWLGKTGKYAIILYITRKVVRVLLQIEDIKRSVTKLAKKYGAERVYLFGSYARGEATEQSDIDLRIDKGSIVGGIALAGLCLDLEDDLGKTIDLVTTGGLDERFLRAIKSEERLMYEAE